MSQLSRHLAPRGPAVETMPRCSVRQARFRRSAWKRHAPACPSRRERSTLRARSSFRRGKSLIEALIIITLTSVVMAASTTTLIALFRVERQGARDGETRQGLARLASRVRADAHAATSCRAGVDCTLTLPGGETVRYVVRSGRLWRERLNGDSVLHRDSYPLAEGSVPAFNVQPLGPKQALQLRIEQPPEVPKSRMTLQPTVITAVIDLHGAAGQEVGS